MHWFTTYYFDVLLSLSLLWPTSLPIIVVVITLAGITNCFSVHCGEMLDLYDSRFGNRRLALAGSVLYVCASVCVCVCVCMRERGRVLLYVVVAVVLNRRRRTLRSPLPIHISPRLHDLPRNIVLFAGKRDWAKWMPRGHRVQIGCLWKLYERNHGSQRCHGIDPYLISVTTSYPIRHNIVMPPMLLAPSRLSALILWLTNCLFRHTLSSWIIHTRWLQRSSQIQMNDGLEHTNSDSVNRQPEPHPLTLRWTDPFYGHVSARPCAQRQGVSRRILIVLAYSAVTCIYGRTHTPGHTHASTHTLAQMNVYAWNIPSRLSIRQHL